jgi:uncharacterized membrane protein YcaP (DUF421 family)
MSEWLFSTPASTFMVIISGLGIYLALMFFTRLNGLRSFSKMSSFDFAIAVALGTIVASTLLLQAVPLFQGIVGLGLLYAIQYGVSKARRHNPSLKTLFDNTPVLLMVGSQIIEEHMEETHMSIDDLNAQLRMAGVTHPNQILAVVMETTGDVSVLKNDGLIDYSLFKGVRGSERLEHFND